MNKVRLLSDHTVFVKADLGAGHHEEIALTIKKGTVGKQLKDLSGLQGHHYTFAITKYISLTIPVYSWMQDIRTGEKWPKTKSDIEKLIAKSKKKKLTRHKNGEPTRTTEIRQQKDVDYLEEE